MENGLKSRLFFYYHLWQNHFGQEQNHKQPLIWLNMVMVIKRVTDSSETGISLTHHPKSVNAVKKIELGRKGIQWNCWLMWRMIHQFETKMTTCGHGAALVLFCEREERIYTRTCLATKYVYCNTSIYVLLKLTAAPSQVKKSKLCTLCV